MRGLRRGLTVWRRSVQARVVVSTVLLCAVVVGLVGWVLLRQVRDGLLDDRVDSVVAEADNETQEARTRLRAATGTDVDAADQLEQVVQPIILRGEARGFSVVAAGPGDPDEPLARSGLVATSGLVTSSVPTSLRRHFATDTTTSWTYAEIALRGAGGRVEQVPGIVVGSSLQLPADDQDYTLYLLFPLDEEADTLALVTRALATAGVLLLVLVAGVAWVVTRQVVAPVREARQVAERLAGGRLEERVRVRGEDDLARLATSFNQMADGLQTQIRQLEELSLVQRRFVSDVSHELLTPLTTVRMAADVLHDSRRGFDAGSRRTAELLHAELERFQGLLADLLEISRFDAGAAVPDLDDVDLGEVVMRVVEGTRRLADRKGTKLVVSLPGARAVAEADVRRVERILRNLVTNAIDHAAVDDATPGEGGETGDVVVTVAGDDHAASVTVRDHGIGLDPAEVAMVFNRFWRADPSRARTTGGTGLGLSIAMEDTRLHGGWLQVWGRPGGGACFRLTLPRYAGRPLLRSPLPLVPADAGAALSSDGLALGAPAGEQG